MKKYLIFFIVVLLLSISCQEVSNASDATGSDIQKPAVLSKYQVKQMWDGEFSVYFYGTNLPEPRIRYFENDNIEIIFDNTINQTITNIDTSEVAMVSDITLKNESVNVVVSIESNMKFFFKDKKESTGRMSISFVSKERQNDIKEAEQKTAIANEQALSEKKEHEKVQKEEQNKIRAEEEKKIFAEEQVKVNEKYSKFQNKFSEIEAKEQNELKKKEQEKLSIENQERFKKEEQEKIKIEEQRRVSERYSSLQAQTRTANEKAEELKKLQEAEQAKLAEEEYEKTLIEEEKKKSKEYFNNIKKNTSQQQDKTIELTQKSNVIENTEKATGVVMVNNITDIKTSEKNIPMATQSVFMSKYQFGQVVDAEFSINFYGVNLSEPKIEYDDKYIKVIFANTEDKINLENIEMFTPSMIAEHVVKKENENLVFYIRTRGEFSLKEKQISFLLNQVLLVFALPVIQPEKIAIDPAILETQAKAEQEKQAVNAKLSQLYNRKATDVSTQPKTDETPYTTVAEVKFPRSEIKPVESQKATASTNNTEIKITSVLSRHQLGQMGDGDIYINFYGTDLPEPEFKYLEGRDDIEIIFKNTRNEIDPKNVNFTELPIVTNITFKAEGSNSVIHLQSDGQLMLKEKRGTPPTNSISMLFVSKKRLQKIEEEKIMLETPLAPTSIPSVFRSTSNVTLSLRNVPLGDVVQMLGQALGKNTVIDKSLPEDSVSINVKNVPFDEVVTYLKRIYDIEFALLGEETIIAGTRDGVSRISGREQTKAFNIAYADVTKIGDVLTAVMNFTEDEKKKIVVDDRLRVLYITGLPERLEEIGIALQRLDSPGKQVMLHARVLEYGKENSLAVQTMINAIYDNWWATFSGGAGMIGIVDGTGPRLEFPKPITPINDIINGTTRMVDAAISATSAKINGKVLANPSVITIDGNTANINLTQEYPFRVSQVSGGTVTYTTERSTAGPNMKMTPKIGRDGIITIDLDLNASEFINFTQEGYPIKSSRQVQTIVRVRNGEPFVIGGLNREYTSTTKTKIPILGDLPLIGFLFSATKSNTSNTQAVMIVIPYILTTPDSAIETNPLPFRRQ